MQIKENNLEVSFKSKNQPTTPSFETEWIINRRVLNILT